MALFCIKTLFVPGPEGCSTAYWHGTSSVAALHDQFDLRNQTGGVNTPELKLAARLKLVSRALSREA
ncbi:hypothetical protein CRENBAI_018013 [Crenichthys baileyi]|uniref:Uncharacterized protein n=1 Tax=Crenichthys baileyi TaxID=28760 RepID=A0AAV9SHV5_9TELE